MLKTITRSAITKLLAVIICIGSMCYGVYTASYIAKVGEGFPFAENYKASYKAVEYTSDAVALIRNMVITNNPEIATTLANEYHIEYYAEKDGRVWTNSTNMSKDYYTLKEVYIAFEDNGDKRNIEASPSYRGREFSELENTKIYVCVNDDFLIEKDQQWQQSTAETEKYMNTIIVCLVVSLLMCIYLAWVAGRRREDDDVHMLLADRLFMEVDAVFIIGVTLLGGGACVVLLDGIMNSEYAISVLNNLLLLAVGITVILELLFLSCIVRNLKNRTFLERSLIWKAIKLGIRIIKWAYSKLKQFVLWIKDTAFGIFSKNFSGRRIILLVLLYSAGLMFFTLIFETSGELVAFLLLGGWIAGGCLLAVKQIYGFDKIAHGIREIRSGNISYKITDCPKGIMSGLAGDINSISDGLEKSLDGQIRAERLKSELITNVSHDLKTPLTSIINYTDLLSDMELTPEDANDYVKIVRQKSERLKNLTSDLFDISKVQSGNEVVNKERLDICLLVRQAMAEMDESITNSDLEFITTYPQEEIFILADGKKMSRVLENLISNAVKYSMNGTRVYVSIHESVHSVTVDIKNISSYPMNFDDKEITQRFVRGDSSRTTEGSGLGLAIAEGYTVACGGKFNIVTDGDLFKVQIIFPIL